MVQLYRALLVFIAGVSLTSATVVSVGRKQKQITSVSVGRKQKQITSAQEDPDPCLEQDYVIKNYVTCCTNGGYRIETFALARAGRGPVCKIVAPLVRGPKTHYEL